MWKKNRSFIIKDNGYDALYAMSSTSLNESDEFEVSDDATNAQIRTAFKKSLKAKTLNKKILSSFIEYVAWGTVHATPDWGGSTPILSTSTKQTNASNV